MRIANKLMIALVTLLASELALASDWVSVGRRVTDDGLIEIVSVDKASVISRGVGIKALWTKHSYNKILKDEAHSVFYKSFIAMLAYKCDSKQFSVIAGAHFSNEEGNGESVSSDNFPNWNSGWNEMPPDSFAEKGFELACEK